MPREAKEPDETKYFHLERRKGGEVGNLLTG